MAEYYHNRYGNDRKRKRNRPPIWALLADTVMAVVSVLAVAGLLAVFIGQFVPPDSMWYFSLPVLVAPLIYMTATAAALYWIIRWKWMAVTAMSVFVVAGLFYVSLFYKLDIARQYGEPAYERGNIKVLSYNVRIFRNDLWENCTDSITEFVKRMQPDIVCFQEFPTLDSVRREINGLMDGYTPCGLPSLSDGFVECYTKYGIIGCETITGMEGTASGITADLRIGNDTVRLVNIHLQTTSISADDKEYISRHRFISDTTREKKIHGIARRLLDNNILRAQQARVLRRIIDDSPYPVIVCGDFNDVPMSYAYRKIARRLDDTFSRAGHGYAHTFRGFYNMLRIDYILVSPDFETLSYEVPQIDASDHYPVFARLKLTQKKEKYDFGLPAKQ